MPGTLNRRKALVTGGTRGIGLEIANQLFALGAQVTVVGRSHTAPQNAGEKFKYIPCDLGKRADVNSLSNEISRDKFDILINNAGINKIAPIADIAPEDFEQILQVNLNAPFRLIQAVIPHMVGQGWGRIINIASIFSVVSKAQRASYSASKFGIVGLTAAVAAEVAPRGVLVNCVSPGFIDTELTQRVLGVDGMEQISRTIPAGRLGNIDEIAQFVCWLASPSNTYISGQNLCIDGGFTRV